MSRDQDHNDAPLRHVEQLVEYFSEAVTPASERGIGTEHEKFGFDRDTLGALAYEGEGGIGRLFAALAAEGGWSELRDGPNVLALEKEGAAITLEPGGQLELSGAVTRTIHQTAAELDAHLDEVARLGDTLNQRWCLLGMNPWDGLDDVPWMPKSRYAIMRRYLPTQGHLAHWMMKMTCTVQANYDYRSEEDALSILRTGVRLSPIVSALFANSPIREGAPSGFASARMEIWEHTDPSRCGVPPFYLREDAGFADYVEYILDVPMFFIRREGAYIDCAGASFRRFMREGMDGHVATMGDFELHLSTAFPEVRMKRYIEVRSADCGSRDHILALPALWKGILYDDAARRDADALLPQLSHADLIELFRVSRMEGLAGHWRDHSLRDLATRLVAVAGAGLGRQALGTGHASEASYLEPLLDDEGQARAPGEDFLARWDELGGEREALQKAYALPIPGAR